MIGRKLTVLSLYTVQTLAFWMYASEEKILLKMNRILRMGIKH